MSQYGGHGPRDEPGAHEDRPVSQAIDSQAIDIGLPFPGIVTFTAVGSLCSLAQPGPRR